MTRRAFDRYMVAVGAAKHVKFRRLTIPERYAFFMGVLSIAAQSPIRGCLLIGDMRAEAEDVAAEAGVPLPVARSGLTKLRSLGIVKDDPDNDCEAVHDFEDWNPAPKTADATATRRKQLQRNAPLRDAIRARDGDLCRYCGLEVDWTDRRSARGGTYDHVDPEGPNSIGNLVVCCRGCNSAKGSKSPAEAEMVLRPSPDLIPIRSGSNEVEEEVEGEAFSTGATPTSPGGNVVDLSGRGAA